MCKHLQDGVIIQNYSFLGWKIDCKISNHSVLNKNLSFRDKQRGWKATGKIFSPIGHSLPASQRLRISAWYTLPMLSFLQNIICWALFCAEFGKIYDKLLHKITDYIFTHRYMNVTRNISHSDIRTIFLCFNKHAHAHYKCLTASEK